MPTPEPANRSVARDENSRLYRQLMLWGFAMVPVSALICYLLAEFAYA
ncbi:MAG: hypothetical protein HXY18_11350 [Bryobacteraceae bacterium]|nr:hypothetical protein [Bryobacteraceae bacterium]